MRRVLLAAALLGVVVFGGFGSAYAGYAFSSAGTDSNGWNWDLTGILETTVSGGQTKVTGGTLQEATGSTYAYSGVTFQVLGLDALPALHGVPGSGGADFIADNLFNPTSDPVFTSSGGITLEKLSGPLITSANNSPPPVSGAPYVNIWGNSPGQYQLLYVYPMDGSGNGYTTPTISATVEVAPVPIPAAAWLFIPGLAAIAAMRKRFTKQY
jgi:hypothetical protein